MTEEQTPIQVTTKDPKKVEAGKRLAEYNRKKKIELKQQSPLHNEGESTKSESGQQSQKADSEAYYTVGGIMVLGLVGGFVYFIYRKKDQIAAVPHQISHNESASVVKTNKFEML